ncbi:MAG: ferritin-like domain-containing protein [bacterium]|nr:ferritin-like domain-containing protein [Candidatus Kapabacteria bacterium]
MNNLIHAVQHYGEGLQAVAKRGDRSDRREFLKIAGATLALFGIASCSDDPTNPVPGTVTLTNDDFGILNFAYALEQLEAAFYTKVVDSFYSGGASDERTIMTDVRDDEKSHVAFFQAALGTKAIASLSVNFSAIDFSNRTKVLQTAYTFEDVGVSAYNGAAQFLSDVKFVGAAAEIVSVEARHASVMRDLLNPKTAAFSDDLITPGGLDFARKPSEILPLVKPYITTTINSQLP